LSTARKLARWGRKRGKRMFSHVRLTQLVLRNRFTRQSVLGEEDVVVSLTTYGPRLAGVGATIESIAAGRARPRHLVLWLDDAESFDRRPATVRRLQRRGLTVALSPDYGPHKKYYPALGVALDAGRPLVTADDDILYPRSWLERLMVAHRAHPEVVSCYRANVVTLAGDRVAPYDDWPRCHSTEPSLAHFATGVAGVLYPTAMLEHLRQHGTAFVERCPRADDIWLHWVALRHGIQVRQVSRTPRHFPLLPGTQGQSLALENVVHRGNDVRIAELYDTEAVEALARAGAPTRAPVPSS
jgi:hypothetical protein